MEKNCQSRLFCAPLGLNVCILTRCSIKIIKYPNIDVLKFWIWANSGFSMILAKIRAEKQRRSQWCPESLRTPYMGLRMLLERHMRWLWEVFSDFEMFHFCHRRGPFFIVKMTKNIHVGQILPSQTRHFGRFASQKKMLVKEMCLTPINTLRKRQYREFWDLILRRRPHGMNIRKTAKSKWLYQFWDPNFGKSWKHQHARPPLQKKKKSEKFKNRQR